MGEAHPDHWTCFHCGSRFTSVDKARDHFGATPEAVPGCMLRVVPGEERGMLTALRKVELERDEHRVRAAALRMGADEEDAVLRFKAMRGEQHE